MKGHIFSIISSHAAHRSRSYFSTGIVLLLMLVSFSSAAALDQALDPFGQVESSPAPISTLTEDQLLPRVEYGYTFNEYLVVWDDVIRDFDHDIYAIRVNDQGMPVYGEISVGASGRMDIRPDIAFSLNMNEYLVVWENEYSTTDHDIYAQRVSADGSLVGGEIHVAYTGAYDRKPVVVYNPWTYQYLVVFERNMGSDEFTQLDIMAQRLTEDGLLMGGEITIANGYLDEQLPAVACDGINYLVAWQGDYSEETNIYGQRVQYDGTLIGSMFGVSTWGNDQLVPRLAYNSDDAQYFVVWEDHYFSPWEINGQRLDQYGNLIGNPVGVAVGGTKNHTDPDVAYMDNTRSYLVVWQFEYSTSDHDIYSRRVAYDGSQPEAEVGISTLGTEEKHPALASNTLEQGMVVWEDWRNYYSNGVDIYGSLETVYVPVLSGVVYEGDPGDYSIPFPGVYVELGCSNDQGYFGTLTSWTWTDAYGQYFLPAYTICEYYNIRETDAAGYFSVGAQTQGGVVYSSNWIYYNYPLGGKVLTGNNFWDKPEGPGDITPPGNWANFEPTGWVNVQTVPVSEQVQDTQSGLDVSTAQYQYSIDNGDVWSGWMPASITGNDGTTDPQTISANVPFGQDSGPDSHNRVMFQVQDIAENTGTSPEYVVRIDSVPPTNPTSISSPTHTPYVWSNNQYITVQWTGATDERSGIYGYSTSYDHNQYTIPDIYRDTADPSQEFYVYEDSNTWWIHVRSLDNAGNAAAGAVHYGPFYIDAEPPTAWFTNQNGSVNVPNITIFWYGGDNLSGVVAYDVQTNTNNGGWVDWRVNTPDTYAVFSGLAGQDVSFRVRARDNAGNIGDWSSLLWIHFGVDVTANVKDESGANLLYAKVYHNNVLIGVTGANGSVTIPDTLIGDSLSAMYLVYTKPAGKPDHLRDGSISWGWRVYLTSIDIPNDGSPQLFHVIDTNVQQQLIVRKDQALIGAHIIIVVQWDATATILNDIREGAISASSFLYDVTDGQFFYETVEIFDNGQNGPANDMYIYTDNTVWPNAFIGAIKDKTGRMMFPPEFGPTWSSKRAYDTMIHEFGHYGLWLFDEYKVRSGAGGGFCTINWENATPDTRASIMAKSDISSELCSTADPNHMHNTNTEQDAQNNGESTWQTVMRVYADSNVPNRWILQSPDTRYVPVVPGPTDYQVSPWMSIYVTDNITPVCAPYSLHVSYEGNPVPDALVTVEGSGGKISIQGKTDEGGNITIRGAYNGDMIFVKIGDRSAYTTITCSPGSLGGESITSPNSIIIEPDPFILDTFILPLNNTSVQIQAKASVELSYPPQVVLWQDAASQPIHVSMSYDAGLGMYVGQASLDVNLDMSGFARVIATDIYARSVMKIVPLNLQTLDPTLPTRVRSSDNRLELLLQPGSIVGDPAITVQFASGMALEQGSLRIIGSAYTIVTSNGEYLLNQPAMLNIYYPINQFRLLDNERLGLYKWDQLSQTWVLVSTDVDSENQLISAEITELGTFAVMAPPFYFYQLPLIRK